ncbi:MAG: hypothetical protein WCF95_02010 [bacterium]
MTNNVSNVSFQSMHKIVSGRSLYIDKKAQEFLLNFYQNEMKFTEEQIQKITHRQNTLSQLEPNEVKFIKDNFQTGIKNDDIALLKNSQGDTFLLDLEDAFISKALRTRNTKESLSLFDMWKNSKMKKGLSGRNNSQKIESSIYFEAYAAKIKEALLKKDENTALNYLEKAVDKRTNKDDGDFHTQLFYNIHEYLDQTIEQIGGKFKNTKPFYRVKRNIN